MLGHISKPAPVDPEMCPSYDGAVDKRALLQRVLEDIEAEIQTLIAAAKATQEGATHEEARPENDKDTRALEASYLARGQAKRVEEMQETHTRLRFFELRDYPEDAAIGAGALVRIEDEDQTEHSYFLIPVGGGRTIEHQDQTIIVLATGSPLGRALLGAHVDDEVTVTIGKRKRELLVLSLE